MIPFTITEMPISDDKAFMEDVYMRFHRLMLATAWKYVNDPTAVEEIISDTCLSLMHNIDTLRELNGRRLNRYIVASVKNRTYNYLARNNTVEKHFIPMDDNMANMASSGENIEDKIVLQDELRRVLREIDKLPEKERLIITLHYSSNLDYHQIAKVAGLSEESVHKYLSRARAKLKKALYKREG